MKSFFVVLGIFAGLPLFLAGCQGEDGPTGAGSTGTLTGTVILTYENGTARSEHSGVAVWIEGGADTVMTDSTGRWSLHGIRTGIYTIVLRKLAFGYMKLVSTHFVGGGDLDVDTVSLVVQPSYRVYFINSDTGSSPPEVTVTGLPSGNPSFGSSVVIFVGRREIDVNDPLTYIDTLRTSVLSVAYFTSPVIRVAEDPWNFAAGDSIFFQVYPASEKLDGYIDPSSGKKVLSTGIALSGGFSTGLVSP